MATTFKWLSLTTQSSVLTAAQLASLANGSYTALGNAYDNSANLDQWAWAKVSLATVTPAAGAFVQLFLSQSLDNGTTYDDGPSASNPGSHNLVGTCSISTKAQAHEAVVPGFRLPPGLMKFSLLNKTGSTLSASGNTITLYTTNEQGI